MVNLSVLVGLFALVIASLFDIRTREVPDWLNFSLAAFAIGSALMLSITSSDYRLLVNAIIGMAAGTLIGIMLFYTGQWGGGDTKLIAGLCAIMGFSYLDFRQGLLLIGSFLVNTMLVGAIYGLGFSFVKAIINFKDFKPAIENKLRSKQVLAIRITLLLIGIAAFLFLLATKSIEAGMIFGLAMSLFLFFYLWAFVGVVEKTCMIKEIDVAKLTEGDWIVGDIIKGKKVLLKPSRTGITLEQIAMLKRHRVKKVTVKEGIPFVPSFLIAYIITFTIGNWLAFFL
ncbi:prepilin peptidase [Candidatus Woesearchaeota archaeon]|nr:prepilin peptidase [Candidatus Woesearchaeota archaeon]